MTPPYNPFAIINRQRGQEVHLPGRSPTSLATAGLLNTGDDASRTAGYYKSSTGLPWAVNIASSWSYPVESAPIVSAYTHFAEWAESGGATAPEWYVKTPANTRAQQLYPSP
jgi:LruC domain-containing protein